MAQVPRRQPPSLPPRGWGRGRGRLHLSPAPAGLCARPRGTGAAGEASFACRATAHSPAQSLLPAALCGRIVMRAYVQFAGGPQIAARAASAHTHLLLVLGVFRGPRFTRRRIKSRSGGPPRPPLRSRQDVSAAAPSGSRSRTICISRQQITYRDTSSKTRTGPLNGAGPTWPSPRSPPPLAWAA